MPKVNEIAAFLDEKIPSSLKEDYDNVGLLCGFPDKEVTRILVVLDITLEVIREAAEMNAELIVSHHPLIFTPMRKILDNTPEGKRVIELLRSGISAICLHTNLDRQEGGVNSALAAALGAEMEQMLNMPTERKNVPGGISCPDKRRAERSGHPVLFCRTIRGKDCRMRRCRRRYHISGGRTGL